MKNSKTLDIAVLSACGLLVTRPAAAFDFAQMGSLGLFGIGLVIMFVVMKFLRRK